MPTKTAHYQRRLFADYDRQLKDAADVVLYSGRKLFREATEPHRFFLEQAVDFDHFSDLKVEPAPELDGIPHPILGYFGTMDYVMDTELMAEVARLRPGWHWVLLGLKSNLVQISAPNIHFLGSKPYRDLAALHPTVRRVRSALAGEQHLHQLRERDQGTRISGHGKTGSDGAALRIFGNAGPAFLSRAHRSSSRKSKPRCRDDTPALARSARQW